MSDPFGAENFDLGPEPAEQPVIAPVEAAEAQPAPPAEPQQEGEAPQPAPTPAPEAPKPPVPEGYVPLSVLMEQRDEAKTAKARVAELERLARAPQPQPLPSVLDDPDGFEQRIDSRIQQLELDTTMRISGTYARRVHGQEKLQTAMDWGADQAKSDPTFGARFISQSDPYEWLVGQHQQAETLSKLGGKSFEEAVAEYARAQGWALPETGAVQPPPVASATPAAPQAPVSPAPTRSIAGIAAATPVASKSVSSENDVFFGVFS